MNRARRGPTRGGLSHGGNRKFRSGPPPSSSGGKPKGGFCGVIVLAALAVTTTLAAISAHLIGAA